MERAYQFLIIILWYNGIMKEHQFNLKLEKELYEWLRNESFKYNKSMAEMVRSILWVEKWANESGLQELPISNKK